MLRLSPALLSMASLPWSFLSGIGAPAFLAPPPGSVRGRGGARRRRTGAAYPHSSARQRARYARQLAAGQLAMDVVAVPVAAKRKARK